MAFITDFNGFYVYMRIALVVSFPPQYLEHRVKHILFQDVFEALTITKVIGKYALVSTV